MGSVSGPKTTGDGMGSTGGGQAPTQPQQQTGASVDMGGVFTEADKANMKVNVDAFLSSMGTPYLTKNSAFAVAASKVHTRTLARTREQKQAVDDALVYLCILNGASPQVAWDGIELVAGAGTRVVMMNDVVDLDIGRAVLRRHMAHYSARAIDMVKSSNRLELELRTRAIRSNLPVTKAYLVIDFLSQTSLNPQDSALRMRAKSVAVARSESKSIDNALSNAPREASRGDDGADDFGNI